jgi:hypothetical protein
VTVISERDRSYPDFQQDLLEAKATR